MSTEILELILNVYFYISLPSGEELRNMEEKRRVTSSKLDGFNVSGDGCTTGRPEGPV